VSALGLPDLVVPIGGITVVGGVVVGGGTTGARGPAVNEYVVWLSAALRSPSEALTDAVVVTGPFDRTRMVARMVVLCAPSR